MACSSEETTRTAETTSQMKPIAFRSYTAEPTRSSAVYSAENGINAGQSIGIYAYYHDHTTWSNAAVPNFMWNQKATCLTKGTDFEYSPLKYWPNDDNSKVSFIAYFPYTVESPGQTDSPAYPDNPTGLKTLLTNEGTNNLGENDTNLPAFSFTVKESKDDQVDFLLTELLPNLPNGTNSVSPSSADDRSGLTVTDHVRFLFKHMTAKVEFRIVADAAIHKDIVSFSLSELSVSNLRYSGTLIPAYDPEEGETSFSWATNAVTHNYDFKTYEPQLLLPQELGDNVKMNVSYSITFKSDGTTYHYVNGEPVADQEYTYTKSDVVQLNKMKRTGTDDALTKWEPNHHYIYTIRLRANRIDFTGQVVDWGDTHDIEGIEIKDE